MNIRKFQPKSEDGQPIWRRDDGSVVACTEKVKVMREALDDLRQVAQDALEDALLMDIAEAQVREAFHRLIDELVNPYRHHTAEQVSADDARSA